MLNHLKNSTENRDIITVSNRIEIENSKGLILDGTNTGVSANIQMLVPQYKLIKVLIHYVDSKVSKCMLL